MQVGGNINHLMQQVMAMKSPELIAVLPTIEEMAFEDRVALVRHGKGNLDSVIKHWDKFSDVLAARGMTKGEVKRKAKDLKNVRGKLDMALRLADPKVIPAPWRPQAETAFNVLAAWFEMNKDYMEAVYSAPKLTRADIANMTLPAVAEAAIGEPADVVMDEVVVDGPMNAGTITDEDLVDVMDVSGNSTVH